MRDEMFPWFSPQNDPTGSKYGYVPGFYTQWHSQGGGIVYADGHAKFCTSESAFQKYPRDARWEDLQRRLLVRL